MYIQPDTKIYILKDCPLDPSYDHTLYWEDAVSQQNYFESIAKYRLTEQSYQRVQKGSMRVHLKAENLYDCNYLMFQNSAFGNKWFYAFIRGVEYINNVTSEITFELDVMQTWFFDYKLAQCFVEREHSETDNIGDNTVPESLEQGPYMAQPSVGGPIPFDNNKNNILLITSFDQSDSTFPDYAGKLTNTVYSGLYYGFYSTVDDVNRLNTVIKAIQAAGKTSGIVACYMIPFDEQAVIAPGYEQDISIPKNLETLSNYHPKNNKLFCYPYNVLRIFTDETSFDFAYEQFMTSERCTFRLFEAVCPEPVMTLTPQAYAGQFGLDRERRMTLANFPQCPFTTQVYETYLGENSASIPVRMLSAQLSAYQSIGNAGLGLASAIGGGSLSTGLSAVAGGVSGVANSMLRIKAINAQLSDIARKPPEVNGVQANAADWVQQNKIFRYKKLTIRPEYARIIDDYFTMFGYATHRVKVPNRSSRTHWNYVKTIGCVIEGSVPADDILKICSLYNDGITFWKNASEIGNYNLDNSPQ